MNVRLFALFILLIAPFFGQEAIKGIAIVGNEENLLSTEQLLEIEGIYVEDTDLPGSLCEFEEILTPYYEGQEWNEETISALKQQIYQYYQKKGRPFIVVIVPQEQVKESNVIQIVVQESRLGSVVFKGSRKQSEKRLKKYLHIHHGEPISTRNLSRDVNFMNRNPFRSVDVIYSPGKEVNTTDLTLKVSERIPYRFYAGFDNTGVPSTGRQRVFAGFSWDQVFGLDHVVSYQYSTNYNSQRFHSNTFQYLALLPNETILNLYGGFSVVHGKIASPNRTNKGTNIQGSIRYQMPLAPFDTYNHETKVGFDLKNTNNTMEFVDYSPTFGQTVNLAQFILGYLGRYEQKGRTFELGFDLVFSPGAWLPDQTDADFESLRPQAKNHWVYANTVLKMKGPLAHSFTYDLFFMGQVSSQVLLPSEQIALGGYGSVRGYDERQYNADTGFYANFEIHSPSFSVIRRRQPNQDQMEFLLFLDGGWGLDKVSVPSVKNHQYLIGIGPGIRYHLGSYLTARCDWGIKLHQQEAFTGGGSMIHFSVIGSY